MCKSCVRVLYHFYLKISKFWNSVFQMLITHFTKPFHINNILLTKELRLEGSNFEEEYQRLYFKARANIRFLWFTDQKYCYTAKPIFTDENGNFIEFVPNINLIGFQFDSEEIGAHKWENWCKTKMLFNKKKLAINELNQLANKRGDNPKNYWITNYNIGLEKCLSVILWKADGTYKNLKLEDLFSIADFNNL